MIDINKLAVRVLRKKYHKNVWLNNLSYESLLFERDELDVPVQLPNSVLAHVYQISGQGQLVLITDVDSQQLLFESFEAVNGDDHG